MICPLCNYEDATGGNFDGTKYFCPACRETSSSVKSANSSPSIFERKPLQKSQINLLRFRRSNLQSLEFSSNTNSFFLKVWHSIAEIFTNSDGSTIYNSAIFSESDRLKTHKFFRGFLLISLVTAIAFSLSYAIGHDFANRGVPMFQAQGLAFLEGRINLAVDWTHDLIRFNDKLYLAIPPLNGFLIAPFIFLFGEKFTEPIFSLVLYAVLVSIQFVYVEKFASDKGTWQRSLFFIFLALGTMILTCALTSTSWFNAVLGSCIFLSSAWLTLYHAKNLAQDTLAISLLAIAATGRFHLAVILPVFILKAWSRYQGKFRALTILSIPAIMFVSFVLWWNWARFGNPLSLKYEDLMYADFFKENIKRYGFRNLVYILPNIYHGIIAFPKLITEFPFFQIDDLGNGILAISPLFIYVLFNISNHNADKSVALIQSKEQSWQRLAWLCMAIIAVPVFTHCSTGWRQFGYRYFLDFLPFAVFLLLRSKVNLLRPIPIFCILLSLWFNIFGTLLFIKPELLKI